MNQSSGATTPTTTTASATAVGVGLCAGSMLLLGGSIAVLPLLGDYPVLMGQAWRYGLAAAVLLAVAPRLGAGWLRPTRGELWLLIALAAMGMAGFNVALIAALDHASPALVSSVVGAAPIALALAAPLLSRRPPRWVTVLGAVLVSLGVAVSHGGGTATLLGVGLAAAAMLCEVGFTLLAAPLLPRLGPVRVAAYGCALAAPQLAVAALVHPGRDLVAPTSTQLAALLWLAIVLTALAFVLWYAGVARLGADRAGLLTGFIPAGALAGTAVLLPGGIHPTMALGAALAAAGIALGLTPRRPRQVGPRDGS